MACRIEVVGVYLSEFHDSACTYRVEEEENLKRFTSVVLGKIVHGQHIKSTKLVRTTE